MNHIKDILKLKEYTKSIDKFECLLKTLSEYYYEGESIVDDLTFDTLVSEYEKLFNKKYSYIGYEITREKEKLPIHMGSLDKIKTNKELDTWCKKYKGPYVISDKVDGVAALYDCDNYKLYKRGDENMGSNISYLLQYLKLPKCSNCYIKGEIVMLKKTFLKKYSNEMSNARSMVAGLTNPMTKNPSVERLRDLIFISYEYISKDNKNMNPFDEYEYLDKLTYITPRYELYNNINDLYEELKENFLNRKNTSLYDMDGIVITNNIYEQQPKDRHNPKNKIAFKLVGNDYPTIVEYVEWNVSKNGILKPRIKVEEVIINDVKVNWASGFNGKFILDNLVGKGTKVMITRSGDVIPYITKVIYDINNKPDLPTTGYDISESGIEFIVKDVNNDDIKIKRLIEFFKILDVKHIGKSTVEKLFNNGFNDFEKLFNITRNDILKIDGFKDKSADRIYNGIINSMKNVIKYKLAAASGCFSAGIGEKKIKLVYEKYRNIFDDKINDDKLLNMIENIKGFKKMSKDMVDGIIKFKNFIEMYREYIVFKDDIINDDNVDVNTNDENKLKDKVIVFTGFRDKELENKLEKIGAVITSGVSKKTNILVVKNKGTNSSKEIKAKEYGIDIYNENDFRDIFKL